MISSFLFVVGLLTADDFNVFVQKPISGTLLGVIALVVLWQLVNFLRRLRNGRPGLAAEPVTPAVAQAIE